MTTPFKQVQRIVLHGSVWDVARHLVLSFPAGSTPLGFLKDLRSEKLWPTFASTSKAEMQLSLGFSRRGLEHALVPLNVLSRFALKSPAFSAGAALRASSQLGASGGNAPSSWDDAFNFMTLDAVLSLQAMADDPLKEAIGKIVSLAKKHDVQIAELPQAGRLKEPPPDMTPDQVRDLKERPQWTHFGYRDGLARIGIEGFTSPEELEKCKPASRHSAGEFVLGYAQNSGANPWIAGPGLNVWPEELRPFFLDGSFGVLQQIEQYAEAFEAFVADKAKALGMDPGDLKAKLCGRYQNGRPLVDKRASPEADFDYAQDDKGHSCPFGSHVRRMNPRGDPLAHAGRSRPLLRRGMPYTVTDTDQRGLIGHFFCASIEDQYEHLVGEWAERVPLGSADRGHARDPLIGAHEHGDGAFEIPRDGGQASLILTGLRPFTRTRGTAYLFYPSLKSLEGIVDECLWGALGEDDE